MVRKRLFKKVLLLNATDMKWTILLHGGEKSYKKKLYFCTQDSIKRHSFMYLRIYLLFITQSFIFVRRFWPLPTPARLPGIIRGLVHSIWNSFVWWIFSCYGNSNIPNSVITSTITPAHFSIIEVFNNSLQPLRLTLVTASTGNWQHVNKYLSLNNIFCFLAK